ncbi:MAG TPA: glycosyltransferase [Ignavibacteriaceae bacterium]|nr:glycosyltransferase [Ignavibacteriaceae bacterium]
MIDRNLTVVVRTVNERTTDACINLTAETVSREEINIVNEIPFSEAVKKSFEIGIEKKKKWTLIIDADVLVRPSFIREVLEFADVQSPDTFVILGLVFDKIFNVFRPAGNHLYRTRFLPDAMKLVSNNAYSIRPESDLINRMTENGLKFIQKDLIAGLHDFEQDYLSIAKKSFVHAHKHTSIIEEILPYWTERAAADLDFYAAMLGIKAGSLFNENVSIDSNFLEERCRTLLDKKVFIPKPPLSTSEYNSEKINSILSSFLSKTANLQEKIFPVSRWNCEIIKEKISFKKNSNKYNTKAVQQNTQILFVANGPNQINGPNIWLQRMLPELKGRGFRPKVIFLMSNASDCVVVKNLRNLGIECRILHKKKYTEENIVELIKIIKKDPPDVFIPNLSVPAYYASKWIKSAGIPTVGVIRSDDKFHNDLIDYFFSGEDEFRLSGFVCKSKFLEDLLISKNVGQIKILRAASGTYMPEKSVPPPADSLKLVYTGRLVQRAKRIFDVIRFMKRAVTEVPGVSACLHGVDLEGGKAIEEIKNARLGEKLEYKGQIEFENIYRVLLQNHVFVLLSEYEGMSTSLMEAMACGLVPVCTKTRSGSAEIIRQNENGLFVETAGDFVEAVKRLKYEKGLWEKLSRNARKTIEEKYSIEISANKWTNFLNDILSDKGKPKEIIIPDINNLSLPPLKISDYGICREDIRMPAVGKNIEDNFLNPQLVPENVDLYLIRKGIKESIIKNLSRFKGILLDLGCGEMPYKNFILNNQPAVTKYIGMDIRNEIYQKNIKPDIYWDGINIPLRDESIDCTFATEVFEHVPYLDNLLRELHRVMKPGGRIFFTVPFLWPLHDIPNDEYRYTPFSLKRIFNAAGFSNTELGFLGGWDASLAQMIGLWLKRSPIKSEDRENLTKSLFPLYKSLAESDITSSDFSSQTMFTGIWGIANA